MNDTPEYEFLLLWPFLFFWGPRYLLPHEFWTFYLRRDEFLLEICKGHVTEGFVQSSFRRVVTCGSKDGWVGIHMPK